MSLSGQRGAKLVELVMQRTKRARVTIVGTSMAPLLRAGMVVDIEPLARPSRMGDILVFKSRRGLVAHRLVGGERFGFRAHGGLIARPHPRDGGVLITGGDAQPERTENVPPQLVVGRVAAVWTDAGPAARRVDDRSFHVRGRFVARVRTLRSLRAKLRAYFVLLAGAAPSAPAGAFRAFTAASRDFECNDVAAGIERLNAIPQATLLELARRHRAGGLIAGWLGEAAAAGVTVPAERHAVFARLAWTSVLQAQCLLRGIRDVRDTLVVAGVATVFLKGAARIGAGEPGAERHYSGDIDVLVPAEQADLAMTTLRQAGYDDIRPFRQRPGYTALHHREPLSSPGVGLPVEIHVALATPAIVGQRLDFAVLASSVRRIDGPVGELDVLDDVAAAVHLAYHARDLHVWRDIVLLSRALRTFDAAARARFDAAIGAETRDGVRLAAAVAAADALVCNGPSPRAAVRRYLAWVALREDLPRPFVNVELIEAFVGRCPRLILGLDDARRGVGLTLRCWSRNLIVMPLIARLALRRCRDGTDPLG